MEFGIGSELIVKLLLDKGADIDVQDRVGWSALHHSCLSSNGCVVKLLLDRGAYVDKDYWEWLVNAQTQPDYQQIGELLLGGGLFVAEDQLGS